MNALGDAVYLTRKAELVEPSLAELIDEFQPEIVDFRFTDMLGRWLHVAYWAKTLKASKEPNITVASSSVVGWGALHDSEMRLRPDLSKVLLDPYSERRTLIVFCEATDPATGETFSRDARATLKRAESYMQATGHADTAFVGPEVEFHLFDSVQFHMSSTECFFRVREPDGLQNSREELDGGNSGHRVMYSSHHYSVPPIDRNFDLRGSMLAGLEAVGLEPLHHQHEAGPSQQELGIAHRAALEAADNVQLLKYVVQSVANKYGKTATFMPKPLAYTPGSGMHLNISLWKAGQPLFSGDQYAGLSEAGLHFIGGILHHVKALNCLLNPGLNSYHRLSKIYHHANPIGYSRANRTSAIRIPQTQSSSARRIEVRFPDPLANPYYAIAAVIMAGLDGIERKLNPGPPLEGNLARNSDGFDVRRRPDRSLAWDLREAIIALDADRDFLKVGGVFNDSQIDSVISEMNRQISVNRGLPHPNEYYIYFSS